MVLLSYSRWGDGKSTAVPIFFAEYSPLLLLLGFFQPLGHLFVICSVTRPALRSTIPTVVFDGHINAAVDEELHRLIVSVPDELVEDACRLMGTPGRVNVRSVLK